MQPQIYAPGAGHVPPGGSLPGREELLRSWDNLLGNVTLRGRVGARDLVLTGNRGVGKTVAMKHCAAIAERHGYARLAFQASREATLSAALQEAVAAHPRAGEAGWAAAVQTLRRITGASVGVAGVSASISRQPDESLAQPDPYNTTAIANALAGLAATIKDRDRQKRGGVLLCIDELQMSAPRDLEALGGVLNHLNNWHPEAPVVFVAAGLPNTLQRMMGSPEHPLISNPARLFMFEPLKQYLTLEQTESALRPAARQHGADWTPEAARAVHDATQGYPAHVQVLAAATWSHAPRSPITAADVRAAEPIAQAEVARMYLVPRWEQMSGLQRAYLTAISMCDTPTETGRVAAMLGRRTTDLSRAREALLRAGDIYSTGVGRISLAQPLMRAFAPHQYHATVERTSGLPTLREMSQARDSWVDGRRAPREPLTPEEIRQLSSPPSSSGRQHQDQDQDQQP